VLTRVTCVVDIAGSVNRLHHVTASVCGRVSATVLNAQAVGVRKSIKALQ